ncbi:MAG: 4-hydroxy-3-methylbut-2-enyl diphosphate reductase [Lentisphaerae bacterium]|nr:4-hydroxy-3-methylbut-2-enyl diphosphate reductase [Lentisphaerota bacterium]
MKITVADSSGFCFGVRQAIKMASDLAKAGEEVEMLGDIVHNENVIREMEELGIRKITELRDGTGKILLIRAHGASKATMEKAKRKNYKVVDATCPMVTDIHKIAVAESLTGRQIIVIGDREHDEVLGIVGQLDHGAIVLENPEDIPNAIPGHIKSASVVVQSTQDIVHVQKIIAKLEQIIPDLVFHNTICGTTRRKQSEIKEMPLLNDIIIVIGSQTSANTKRLYEISKKLNNRTYWLNSPEEVNQNWLTDVKSVGIMAGASTPDYTTDGVIKRIHELTSDIS